MQWLKLYFGTLFSSLAGKCMGTFRPFSGSIILGRKLIFALHFYMQMLHFVYKVTNNLTLKMERQNISASYWKTKSNAHKKKV